MDFNLLDQKLRETFADKQLSNYERDELRELGEVLKPEETYFLRNRAFAMVQDVILDESHHREDMVKALTWLRQVIRTLDQTAPTPVEASAHFTPGESCRRKIIALCQNAKHSIDICVFTISDNHLSEQIIKAHRRGVKVRIITDDEKQYDAGSDIQLLQEAKIPLRMDESKHHMHHKFALFDAHILLNGSFNWTASASDYNAENLLTSNNPTLVNLYLKEFEKLWKAYI
ncbi:MAG: phospholipase D-like domain-containing protein [Saezia sp.]